MASKPVVDAVNALLAANPIAGLTVIGPNIVGDTPSDGSPWLTVQYPVGVEKFIGMAGVGNRVFREEGTIRLVLSIRRGQGDEQGLAWMETLRSLFRGAQFGGVTVLDGPSPPINDNANDQGVYWVQSTSIPYFYDRFA